MSYSKYFSSVDFCLYWGNCIEILKELEPNSFDMIFADPPYFLSDGTITCKSGKMVSVKKVTGICLMNFPINQNSTINGFLHVDKY